jgi:hypothetical protein
MGESEMAELAAGSGGVVAGEIQVHKGELADISGGKIGLTRSSAEDIQADSVRMMQSAARSVRGAELSATMTAALQMDAQNADMRFCSVGLLDAEHAEIGPGSVYAAVGQDVNLKSCYAKVVLSQGSVQMNQSLVGVAAAREIEASEVRAGFLIAREVRGTVRTLMDTRSAAVFGAAFGAAFAAMWLLRRR